MSSVHAQLCYWPMLKSTGKPMREKVRRWNFQALYFGRDLPRQLNLESCYSSLGQTYWKRCQQLLAIYKRISLNLREENNLRQCPLKKTKKGRRWYNSNHRFLSNLAQMLGLVSKWIWQKLMLNIIFPSRYGDLLQNGPLSLFYAY